MGRLIVSKADRAFIIKNHAAINPLHKSLCAEGFLFLKQKARFWRRKNGCISVNFVYRKDDNDGSFFEEQGVLLTLTAEQTTLIVDMQKRQFSLKVLLK